MSNRTKLLVAMVAFVTLMYFIFGFEPVVLGLLIALVAGDE